MRKKPPFNEYADISARLDVYLFFIAEATSTSIRCEKRMLCVCAGSFEPSLCDAIRAKVSCAGYALGYTFRSKTD